jgi:hypothetical protein
MGNAKLFSLLKCGMGSLNFSKWDSSGKSGGWPAGQGRGGSLLSARKGFRHLQTAKVDDCFGFFAHFTADDKHSSSKECYRFFAGRGSDHGPSQGDDFFIASFEKIAVAA